jgi:hypothetical protein
MTILRLFFMTRYCTQRLELLLPSSQPARSGEQSKAHGGVES